MNEATKVKTGLKKEFYLFEPKRVALGMDIGDKSIKMAVLKDTPRETQLLKLASADIPIKEGQNEEEKEAVLASSIEKILKENNIKAKYVYTNLPWEQLQVKIMSVPYMPEAELSQGLQFEAQQHFSFPLENAQFDYMIIDEVAGAEGRMLELVVVACQDEEVEKRISLFEKIGLKPALLGITPLALWNSFEKMDPKNKDKVVALLDLKDIRAHVSIFMKGKLRFVRDITLKQPLSGLNYETIEELVTEVGRTFDFYKAQSRVEKIDRLVFSGEGIKASNLGSILGEKLGVAVQKTNPLKNISVNGDGDSQYDEEMLPVFTTSIGFALMSQKAKTINLLPKRFIKERVSFKQRFIPWIAAALLVIIISSIHIGILVKKRSLRQKRNGLALKVNEFRELYNEFSGFESNRKEIEEKLGFINNRIQEQKIWPELFRSISEVIPDEIWLNSLKSRHSKKGRFLELNGYGFSNQAAVKFVGGLKGIPCFVEVKLNFIRAEVVARRKVVSFEIICQFKETE